MALLEVKDLRVSFPSRNGPVHALRAVSFVLEKGQILGIVGESGSGKSVTALAVLRMTAAPGVISGGEVLLEGTDLLRLPMQQMRRIRGRDVFLIFQSPRSTLNPTMMTGRQLTECLARRRGLTKRSAITRMHEILREVGLSPDRADAYPFELSGGIQQRVLIAMALALQPKVLIADEPTTGLDAITQMEILGRLRRLRDELGTAIILITHDFRVVAFMADQVAVMHQGSVVDFGNPCSIMNQPRDSHTLDLVTGARRLASY
jgi:peptide/nickel transport system ATP-binding protein